MAQNYKGPMDYIDVASRIVEFREKYPEGRLRQASLEFVRDFAGKDWVVYTAEAWRTPDDPSPAQGTAWEPVPGPTQFTRDSEVQNAETAAWGRAMVAALAVDTRKGIASQEEVRNRQPDASAKPSVPEPPEGWEEWLAACDTLPALQDLYDDRAHKWFTPQVRAAFTARKSELEAA